MRKILFKIYLLFFFVDVTQLILSQSPYYYHKRLGVKEGLSQSKVQCVLNDHRGYLQVGTESGLNCHDRDRLEQYLHRPGDERALPSNSITFTAEDSLCNLRMVTMNGICLYDRGSDSFRTLSNDDKLTYVTSCLLVEGGVLPGGSGAIYKYVYATNKLGPLYYAQDPVYYNPLWRMIRYDEENVLLNSHWHGIYSFSMKTYEVEKVESSTENDYISIYLDSYKRLRVSIYGNGPYCYQGDQLIKHFTASNSPSTYDIIHNIMERDNQLWVITDGGGINIIFLDDFLLTAEFDLQMQ